MFVTAPLILFVLTPILTAHSAFSLNCSIFQSDKDIILSLPFLVFINRHELRNISYALVDRWGSVTEFHVFEQTFIPFSIFCFAKLKSLSITNSNFYIPAEIARLSSTLEALTIANLNTPQKTLPTELFTLTSLKTLRLTYCGIEVLPDEIGNLTGLMTLDLQGNNLGGLLPNSIQQLKHLNKLDVSNNALITSLDVLNGSAGLRELRASHCGLIQLPPVLYCLSTLDLSYNKLTSLDGIETMLQCLPFQYHGKRMRPNSYYWCPLADFDVSYNKLSTVPEELYRFVHLQKLNLQNNQFSNQEMEWIVGRFRMDSHSKPVVII